MSLNHGVNELADSAQSAGARRQRGDRDQNSPGSSNMACSSALSTYLWSRISLGFGATVTSAVKKRM